MRYPNGQVLEQTSLESHHIDCRKSMCQHVGDPQSSIHRYKRVPSAYNKVGSVLLWGSSMNAAIWLG